MATHKLQDLIFLVDAPDVPRDNEHAYENCNICTDPLWTDEYTTNPASQPPGTDHLPARPRACEGHVFHLHCIKTWIAVKAICPLCRTPLAVIVGYQPVTDGSKMAVSTEPSKLPGNPTCDTIVIKFTIAAGVQELDCPIPGERFNQFEFTTFLPNHSEGQEVVRLLTLAWNRRLLFRIGHNPATGRMDTIVINGFELKTRRDGGIHLNGFPDDSYLSRLKMDLREVGIE